MSTPALPPNPCLVAIILITKNRRGVKRNFHYPPNPGKDKPHHKPGHGESSDDHSSSESDEDRYSSLEDDDYKVEKSSKKLLNTNDYGIDESGSISPEKNGSATWNRRANNPNHGLLGLPFGFESLLCPNTQYHKKRFEMSIDQLVFLGWPVFARENGEWKKRKHYGPREQAQKMSTISEQELVSMSRRTSVQLDEALGETTGNESIDDDRDNALEDDATQEIMGIAPLQEQLDSEDGVIRKHVGRDLSMFNVVFVMNPPPLEYQIRVDEMYKHVVKKFSRALKWEQARSDYVQKECEKMKSLKAKHESSSQNAIRNSSLAKAIAVLYNSISTSRIAHIELTTHLTFSLQLPIPTSISHLPDATSPQLPGLWLTTATSIPSNDDLHTTRSKLASHFALLLLSDLPSILADISSTSSPLSVPLINYLRVTTPRKSFLQISQSSGIPLGDIHFLASHLIYWRRARAVPPLHQRDIYIVSPNANRTKLRSATAQYAKLFPVQLPTLPKMLSLLSAGPRPFNTLIPSKDHKPIYFEILAWLLRNGWVTQLRTFAWVRIPVEIQSAVAGETNAAASAATAGSLAQLISVDKRDGNDASSSEVDDPGEPDLPSGTLSPSYVSGLSSPSSLSSARTAIPLALRMSTGSPSLSAHSVVRDVSSEPLSLNRFQPILVLQPTKASGVESRYLERVGHEIESAEGREVHEAWERCMKYFNGEHALEKIAVREGWKRKKVEGLIAIWSRMGILVEVRHW